MNEKLSDGRTHTYVHAVKCGQMLAIWLAMRDWESRMLFRREREKESILTVREHLYWVDAVQLMATYLADIMERFKLLIV